MAEISPVTNSSPPEEISIGPPPPSSSSRVPPSRRRDKPQLSCNLCRRRKLKCDRSQPCSTCAHRGLSLSCTYSDSSHISQPGQRARQAQPQQIPNTSSMQNRIGQLEKLVVELMGNMAQPITTSTASLTSVEADSSSSDYTHVDYTQDPSQLDDRFGRISLGSLGTKYVENEHWSAILDGVCINSVYQGQVATDALTFCRSPSSRNTFKL